MLHFVYTFFTLFTHFHTFYTVFAQFALCLHNFHSVCTIYTVYTIASHIVFAFSTLRSYFRICCFALLAQCIEIIFFLSLLKNRNHGKVGKNMEVSPNFSNLMRLQQKRGLAAATQWQCRLWAILTGKPKQF